MEEIKLHDLIYLDVEFVALRYEEITGDAPSSQFTKTEGMKAGLKIPVLSAGVHTQETRSYQLSSLGMLKKIWGDLSKYPSFDKSIYATIEKTSKYSGFKAISQYQHGSTLKTTMKTILISRYWMIRIKLIFLLSRKVNILAQDMIRFLKFHLPYKIIS